MKRTHTPTTHDHDPDHEHPDPDRPDTPTPEALADTAREALELIEALPFPTKHQSARAIYQALAVGAYHAATQRALQSDHHRATSTPRGLIAQLRADFPALETARQVRELSARLVELIEHAERGVDVGGALREMWGDSANVEAPARGARNKASEDTLTAEDCADALPARRARGARARAESAAPAARREEEGARAERDELAALGADTRPDRRVRLAAASDPYRQGPALAALTERLRAEHPPPLEPLDALTSRQALRGGSVLGTGAARAAWLTWLDEVARAWPGPLSVADVQRLAHPAPASFVASIWSERVELLRAGIDEGSRRALALALLAEAEALGREALAVAQAATDERSKLAALKLSLDTLARRASLAGLDAAKLSVEVSAGAGAGPSPEARLAAMGLDLDTLARIGDTASRALSLAAPKKREG